MRARHPFQSHAPTTPNPTAQQQQALHSKAVADCRRNSPHPIRYTHNPQLRPRPQLLCTPQGAGPVHAVITLRCGHQAPAGCALRRKHTCSLSARALRCCCCHTLCSSARHAPPCLLSGNLDELQPGIVLAQHQGVTEIPALLRGEWGHGAQHARQPVVQRLDAWVWHHQAWGVAAVDHVQVLALAPAGRRAPLRLSTSAGIAGGAWVPGCQPPCNAATSLLADCTATKGSAVAVAWPQGRAGAADVWHMLVLNSASRMQVGTCNGTPAGCSLPYLGHSGTSRLAMRFVWAVGSLQPLHRCSSIAAEGVAGRPMTGRTLHSAAVCAHAFTMMPCALLP